MMVIQAINNTGNNIELAGTGLNGATTSTLTINDGATAIFPADRCTWTFGYDSSARQYEIGNVVLFSGTANSVLPATLDIQLGYIGKSGRFVAITE